MGVGARRAARRQRGFVTLFEDFRGPDLAARLRGIAIAPIAAIVISQLYATLYPLLPRVPAALFAAIDLILFAGAAVGIGGAARLALRHRRELDGRAIAWLVACTIASLFCLRLFVSMTMPWL